MKSRKMNFFDGNAICTPDVFYAMYIGDAMSIL